MASYEITITRTVQTTVTVDDCESPQEAVAVVDRVNYELPPAAEWSVLKYSYEYAIEGEEVSSGG